MGAPNSVVSDILQLCILAGKRRQGNTEINVLQPEGVRPITQYGTDTWPHAVAASDLFLYSVPKGQCLIVTYVDFYTGLVDGSDAGVNFGIPIANTCQWKVSSGANMFKTALLDSIAYVNTPCFYVFGPETTPVLSIPKSTPVGNITVDSLHLHAHMQGYLLDAAMFSVFRKYQTVSVTT